MLTGVGALAGRYHDAAGFDDGIDVLPFLEAKIACRRFRDYGDDLCAACNGDRHFRANRTVHDASDATFDLIAGTDLHGVLLWQWITGGETRTCRAPCDRHPSVRTQ